MYYTRLKNLFHVLKQADPGKKPPTLHRSQRGFSTTELMIYIAIVGIMLGAIFSTLSTDKSRATSMATTMSNMASAMQRAKADMGCYPKVPGALWDPTAPTATNMYCGLAGLVTWAGPYINKAPVDSTGAQLQIPTIGDSAYVTINREATPAGGLGWYYYLRANNIPNTVISNALQVCNGKTDSTVTFSNAKCRGTPGTGGTEIGTFDMIIEESR